MEQVNNQDGWYETDTGKRRMPALLEGVHVSIIDRPTFIARTRQTFAGSFGADRGASAVEFALIVPFLILMTGAIVEITNIYFVRSQLTEIAGQAARRLAVGALDEEETTKFVAAKLADQAAGLNARAEVIDHTLRDQDGTDVTVSISLALNDALIFEFVGASLGPLPDLTVAATMFKQ